MSMFRLLVHALFVLPLLVLPLLATGAPTPEDLLSHYREAFQQQDADRLADLLSPDAEIRLLMEQPGAEPLTITLTEDEYLQQLRALWRFSEDVNYSYAKKTEGEHSPHTAIFTQKERYQLFGETLHRESRMLMRIMPISGALLISEIEALIREE